MCAGPLSAVQGDNAYVLVEESVEPQDRAAYVSVINLSMVLCQIITSVFGSVILTLTGSLTAGIVYASLIGGVLTLMVLAYEVTYVRPWLRPTPHGGAKKGSGDESGDETGTESEGPNREQASASGADSVPLGDGGAGGAKVLASALLHSSKMSEQSQPDECTPLIMGDTSYGARSGPGRTTGGATDSGSASPMRVAADSTHDDMSAPLLRRV